jgi:hypothetical protein
MIDCTWAGERSADEADPPTLADFHGVHATCLFWQCHDLGRRRTAVFIAGILL